METLHIVVDTLLWAYFVLTLGGAIYQTRKRKK